MFVPLDKKFLSLTVIKNGGREIDTTHSKAKQTRTKRYENKERIFDARSKSRKEFIKIKLSDPKLKLQEIPLKKAKERRQKTLKKQKKKIKIKLII